MEKFTETRHCKSRRHCQDCRKCQSFRNSLRTIFEVPPDFDQHCPMGITLETILPPVDSQPLKSLTPSVENQVLPANPSPVGDKITVTVTGFLGDNSPNGTWEILPGAGGALFGHLFVEVIPVDGGWNLEISKKCCGGRKKQLATGKIVELGLSFEVAGSNVFSNQKGTGLAEKKISSGV